MAKLKIINLAKKIAPIVLILFVCASFFWKFFLKGLIPLPADIVVGMYHPWLDYKWGFIVGVPVKNSLLSDVVSQIFPLRIYALELLKQGILPLWNPLMFAGYPLLGNIQLGILNPTSVYFLIFSKPFAWGLQTFTQPVLAAIFMYLFLRNLRLGKFSSVFGAIIYAFCGFNIIWQEWNTHSFTTAYLPLILFLTSRYLETKNRIFGPLICFALCLQIFSGYPQIVFYTIAVVIFFGLFFFGFKKSLLEVMLWLFFGVLLSSVQLFPTIELFWQSQRKFEFLKPQDSYLPWQSLISFLIPDFFGNQTTGNFWGPNDYTTNVAYSGVISFVFALFTLKSIKERKVLFFWVLLGMSLVFCLPPLPTFFYSMGMKSAMAASRILFLANFALAVLASLAFEKIKKDTNFLDVARIAVYSLVVFGGILVGSFWAKRKLALFVFSENRFYSSEIVIKWINNLTVGLRNSVFPLLILVLVIFLLFILLSKNRTLKFLASLFIFLLAIVELFRFGWKFLPFTSAEMIFPQTPTIDFLQRQEGLFRVEGGGVIPMNMLSAYGLESFSGYDPMYPKITAQYLGMIDNATLDYPKARYGHFSNYDSNLAKWGNVCYVLGLKKRDEERFFGKTEKSKYKLVFEDKSVFIVYKDNCLPRAMIVEHYEVIDNENEFIQKTSQDQAFQSGKKIYLSENPGRAKILSTGEIKTEIKWTRYSPNYQEMETFSNKDGFLFVSDTYYPGWEAQVDNKKTKIFRSNFLFRSVFLPEGKHKVVFKYRPLSIIFGFAISLLTLVTLVFFEVKLILPKRKN